VRFGGAEFFPILVPNFVFFHVTPGPFLHFSSILLLFLFIKGCLSSLISENIFSIESNQQYKKTFQSSSLSKICNWNGGTFGRRAGLFKWNTYEKTIKKNPE
jgi:hypothetical protein